MQSVFCLGSWVRVSLVVGSTLYTPTVALLLSVLLCNTSYVLFSDFSPRILPQNMKKVVFETPKFNADVHLSLVVKTGHTLTVKGMTIK
jgi:hypothetical protein